MVNSKKNKIKKKIMTLSKYFALYLLLIIPLRSEFTLVEDNFNTKDFSTQSGLKILFKWKTINFIGWFVKHDQKLENEGYS